MCMQRRNFLAAASVVPLMAVPAIAAQPETPVIKAYREWHAYSEWLNSPATRGYKDHEFDQLTEALWKRVQRVMATPPQNHFDTIVKVYVVTTDLQLFHGEEGTGPLEDEIADLVADLQAQGEAA